MNLFEAKAIYDSKSGKFLEEFYINGNPVDCDEYYFYLEREKDVEDNKLEENKCKEQLKETVDGNPYEYSDCEKCNEVDNCLENGICCGECDCGDNDERIECFDYDELLEIFTKRIQDTGGCPECIKEILDEFADNFIPDYDEDEFECNDCQCTCECECENGEFSDEQLEEIKIIEGFTDNIMNIKCGAELRNELYRLYSMGKSIGWNDHCCFIQKLIDDEENKESKNDKTKNNITCNLTVNNTKDDMNKVAEQILNMINNSTRWG